VVRRKLRELREKSDEELIDMLNKINEELFKLRKIVESGGGLEKPGKIKALRKDRARILTILRERGIKV